MVGKPPGGACSVVEMNDAARRQENALARRQAALAAKTQQHVLLKPRVKGERAVR